MNLKSLLQNLSETTQIVDDIESYVVIPSTIKSKIEFNELNKLIELDNLFFTRFYRLSNEILKSYKKWYNALPCLPTHIMYCESEISNDLYVMLQFDSKDMNRNNLLWFLNTIKALMPEYYSLISLLILYLKNKASLLYFSNYINDSLIKSYAKYGTTIESFHQYSRDINSDWLLKYNILGDIDKIVIDSIIFDWYDGKIFFSNLSKDYISVFNTYKSISFSNESKKIFNNNNSIIFSNMNTLFQVAKNDYRFKERGV